MNVTPFRLIPDRALVTLERKLAPLVAEWCRQWLDAEGALRVARVNRADDRSLEEKVELWAWEQADELTCVMSMAPGTKRKWLSLMLRTTLMFDTETEITTDLWTRAASTLANAVTTEISKNPVPSNSTPKRVSAMPSAWSRPGSGWVRLQFAGELGGITLLFRGYSVDGIDTTQEPVVGSDLNHPRLGALLQSAIADRSLRAEMILASEELALGELLGLSVGDVIALNQRCDEPLSLRFDGTEITLKGFLGQRQGVKAFWVESAAPVNGMNGESR